MISSWGDHVANKDSSSLSDEGDAELLVVTGIEEDKNERQAVATITIVNTNYLQLTRLFYLTRPLISQHVFMKCHFSNCGHYLHLVALEVYYFPPNSSNKDEKCSLGYLIIGGKTLVKSIIFMETNKPKTWDIYVKDLSEQITNLEPGCYVSKEDP
ncbi:hypothetical protein BDQ12DRAFT_666024 [Crucibulum laeve]|uniref:Uncharacterized protein n=1 Tax=Crucibulum laeve TaxID=68775 RepID=A0A5C3M0S3_9AGAR|nr:hypothetical protein BDQ12DRAFT_666024 [Crucibulum laeve]